MMLPAEVRKATSAEEMVELLSRGAGDRQLTDDVTVVALRRV